VVSTDDSDRRGDALVKGNAIVAPDDGAWHGLAAIRFEIEPPPD
jgi:hypothetical protein